MIKLQNSPYGSQVSICQLIDGTPGSNLNH